jgi:hypothetical protein
MRTVELEQELGPDAIDCDGSAPKGVGDSYLVLPCHSVASADWTRVFAAVREDSDGERGFSFIHDESFAEPRAIIGWYQEADRPFILCTLRSCTPLADGSYRVRLLVDTLIRLEPKDVETMRQVLAERSTNGGL